jgi:hypothetical protein
MRLAPSRCMKAAAIGLLNSKVATCSSPAGDGSSRTLLEALVQADVGFAALPCVFPHLSAARPDLLDPLLELKRLPQDSLFVETEKFRLGWHWSTDLLWVNLPVECWWVAVIVSCAVTFVWC